MFERLKSESSMIIQLIGLLLIFSSLTFIPPFLASTTLKIIFLIAGILLIILGFVPRLESYKLKLIVVGGVISLVGIGLLIFSPITNFLNLISDILSIGLIYFLLLLISGVILIIIGNFLFKILGVLLLFISVTGGAQEISQKVAELGPATPNYFLFIIALITGLIFFFKVEGRLSKILGVVLPILTFPLVGEWIMGEYSSIGILIPEVMGVSIVAIVITIFLLLSAIYLFTKMKEFSPVLKTISSLLALLLVALSFPFVFSQLIKVIEIVVMSIETYTSPELFQKITATVIGIICFLGGKKSFGYAKSGFERAKGEMGKAWRHKPTPMRDRYSET